MTPLILHTLRYLVLSYVTSPTTMSAMTDIPANTPSPIGKTSSFLPGTDAASACAAAADGVVTEVDTEPSDKVVTTVTGKVSVPPFASIAVPPVAGT